MPRIVSLIASATEIVCALGFEDSLVGISHECDFPESIRGLPVCTAAKFDVHGSSAEIDRLVKEVLERSASVYQVHLDKLKELRPDVIVTQMHCQVCAVSERDVEQALGDWLENRPRIVSLCPGSLTQVWVDIRRVADALDVPERGHGLVETLQNRLDALAVRSRRLPHHPTVACLEWIDPLMAAGNWVPELVEIAGGVDLLGTAGQHSPGLGWDKLLAADAEVIVAMPCGLDLPRTRAELTALTQKPDWHQLRAVQTGKVFVTDGNQYFNRPGPRLVESAQIMAQILHPHEYQFGMAGWERFWQS